MPENSREQDSQRPGDNIISTYLFDKKNLEKLLGSDKATKERVTTDLQKLKIEEINKLATTILTDLGREDTRWNQDTRDGALEILKVLNFKKVSPAVYETYIKCIKAQGQVEEVDIYGTVSSLLEAGKILASSVPASSDMPGRIYGEWDYLRSALQRKLGGFGYRQDDDQYIREEAIKIIDGLRSNQENEEARAKEVEDETFGYRREAPEMDPDCRFLYNKYIEVTSQRPTYKSFLWEHTPNFRNLCTQHGIPLERFWNLNNPEDIVSAVNYLRQQPLETIQIVLDKALKKITGLNLAEAPDEYLGIFADEVVKAAFSASQELLASTQAHDFDQLKARFGKIIAEAQTARPQGRAKLIGPILRFLEENGQDITNLKAFDQLASFWANDQNTTMIRESIQRRQQDRIKAAESLSSLFNLKSQNRNIALASREKNDLYLGDVTGDCTAFHLHTGMNAWTVPVWLSNPGFSFFKVLDDQGQLVAKLGLILALDNGKPAIVIDSIETSKRIKDEEQAKLQIKNGFQALKAWASKIGMPNVYIEKLSNSTELNPILDEISQDLEEAKLEVLGGLSGVSELRTSIGEPNIKEKIYLQSAHEAKPDEEDIVIIERDITKALSVSSKEQRQEIEELIRKHQWEALFAVIIDLNYSEIGKLMGKDYGSYLALDTSIEFHLEEMISEERERLLYYTGEEGFYHIYKGRHTLPDLDEREQDMIEQIEKSGFKEDLPSFNEDKFSNQATKLDELVLSLQKINKMGFTPERVLEILYDKSSSSGNNLLPLTSTIAKLS